MISRRRLATLVLAPAALFLIETACNRVPLLAPSGSSITLATATTVLPINGTATIIAQVIEAAGTPPQAGTHVTFTTSLGTVEPSEASTDTSGQVRVTFSAASSGTATITAISGGANVGSSGALKILVGTAAVQKVVVNASPATVPSVGGSTTVSATVFDVNGNLMVNVPVTFTTTAGTLSAGVVNTSPAGVASATLTTAISATVTAGVGVGTSTTAPAAPPTTGTPTTGTPAPTTPSASGTASGSVTVNIASAPTIIITPPTTAPSAGLPASFTIAVTVPAANGSAIKAVSVDWGDGSAQELGSVTGNSVVSHVYKDAASYLIKASATDASGNTVSVSTVVTVVQAPQPTIIITYSPVPAKVNTTTTITIQVTVPSGLGVLNTTLDFGDGTDPSGLGGAVNATQPHVYTVQKTYTVTVTVKTTNNVTTTGTTAIAVGL